MKRAAAACMLWLVLIGAPAAMFGAGRPVRVGSPGLASDAGLFLALDKGFFREQGVEVSMERAGTTAEQVALLASGRLDIGGGALAPAFFNAIVRGIPLVAVADKGSVRKGAGYLALIVRKALVDSGRFGSLRDLKGMVLASPDTTANIGSFLYHTLLKSAGMTLRDVTIEAVPLADQLAAMSNGKIDAVIASEPFPSAAETRGIGKVVLTLDQLLPGFQLGIIFYNRDWATRYPEVARRWILAYVKGLRYYNHFLQDRRARDDVVGILAAHTPIKDRAVWDKMVWPGLDPDGAISIRGLLEYERWLLNEHQISRFVLPDQLADLSYVHDAARVLGPYRP